MFPGPTRARSAASVFSFQNPLYSVAALGYIRAMSSAERRLFIRITGPALPVAWGRRRVREIFAFRAFSASRWWSRAASRRPPH